MTPDPLKSTVPAEAKIIKAQGAANTAVIGMLTELVACGLATWLLSISKIDSTMWLGVIMYALSGQVIGKARGGPGAPTTLTLAGLGPWILAAVKKSTIF